MPKAESLTKEEMESIFLCVFGGTDDVLGGRMITNYTNRVTISWDVIESSERTMILLISVLL